MVHLVGCPKQVDLCMNTYGRPRHTHNPHVPLHSHTHRQTHTDTPLPNPPTDTLHPTHPHRHPPSPTQTRHTPPTHRHAPLYPPTHTHTCPTLPTHTRRHATPTYMPHQYGPLQLTTHHERICGRSRNPCHSQGSTATTSRGNPRGGPTGGSARTPTSRWQTPLLHK